MDDSINDITRYAIEDYYEKLQAPQKQLHYVPEGGHNALQNNPEAFYQIMDQAIRDTLQ